VGAERRELLKFEAVLAGCSVLFAYDFNEHTLLAAAIKFAIEDLFPRALLLVRKSS
jgi:hypothetical protein